MGKWTQEEKQLLRRIYPTATQDELREQISKHTINAIQQKAFLLGIKKYHRMKMIYSLKQTEKINLDKIKDSLGYFIAGFTAGEGCFNVSKHGGKYDVFQFVIGLSGRDKQIIHKIQETFGCGYINKASYPNGNYDYQVYFNIHKFGEIVKRVIPFFEKYTLHNTYKKEQYEQWKRKVMETLETIPVTTNTR